MLAVSGPQLLFPSTVREADGRQPSVISACVGIGLCRSLRNRGWALSQERVPILAVPRAQPLRGTAWY